MAIDVTPKAPEPAEPAPTVDPSAEPDQASAPAEGQSNGIPDAVLQIPAIQAVLAGKPAAVSAPLAEFSKRPEAKAIIDNKDALMKAGFGLYKSLSGDIGVVFNSFHLHPTELVTADKAGKLQQIAPPFDQVNDMVSKAGPDNHPLLTAGAVPGGPKGMPMPTPPQMNSNVMPSAAPAGVAKKIATARISSLNPGSPTSGPSPGAGRLMASILKPVV